jgi:hypothetical protein
LGLGPCDRIRWCPNSKAVHRRNRMRKFIFSRRNIYVISHSPVQYFTQYNFIDTHHFSQEF